MKQGMVYGLGLVIVVLALVILIQQRKLGNVRNENASLRGDARAMVETRNADATAAADVQRELRLLRMENDELRRQLQQLRERGPARTNE